MALSVQPTSPGDLDAIAGLLCSSFGAPPDAPFVNRDLLQWKYIEAAGSQRAARSFVLRQGADVVAHCATTPVVLKLNRPDSAPESVSGVCFLDWAGDRRLPGAGVILLKKLMAANDISVVASGSEAARALVGKLGFTERQTIAMFARVVRPFHQARSRPRTSRHRDGLRLLRNAMWSLAAAGRLDPDWESRRIRQFTTLPPGGSNRSLAAEHPANYLNYWLRCPSAKISGFEILRRGTVAGHFLVSRIGGQSRVADLRLTTDAPPDLAMAYRLALRAAAADPATCEVVCIASSEETGRALEACGFRQRGAAPLFVFDPRGVLSDAPPIAWSMIDDDTAYVYDPLNPYAT